MIDNPKECGDYLCKIQHQSDTGLSQWWEVAWWGESGWCGVGKPFEPGFQVIKWQELPKD